MTVFSFVFKRFFKGVANIAFISIIPLAAIFLPLGEWHPLPGGFQYYGIIQLFLAARLSGIILEDRSNKTLLRIGAAPISHFQYLFQNTLAYSLIMLMINLVFVLGGVLVHGEVLINPGILLVLYTFFGMLAISFSLAWFSLFDNKEAAFSVLTGLAMLMAMLGGMMWPIQAMPLLLQRTALLLPTYWLAEAILRVAGGATISQLIMPIAMMLLFSIGFIFLGSRKRLF